MYKILSIFFMLCSFGVMEVDGERVFTIQLDGSQGAILVQMFENYSWLRFDDDFPGPVYHLNPGFSELYTEVQKIISTRAPELEGYTLSFFDAQNNRPINMYNFNWLPIFSWFCSWFSLFKAKQLRQGVLEEDQVHILYKIKRTGETNLI